MGVSVVNDGEYGKAMRTQLDHGAWLSYVMQRLTGWARWPADPLRWLGGAEAIDSANSRASCSQEITRAIHHLAHGAPMRNPAMGKRLLRSDALA